jgi:hypothetical protein
VRLNALDKSSNEYNGKEESFSTLSRVYLSGNSVDGKIPCISSTSSNCTLVRSLNNPQGIVSTSYYPHQVYVACENSIAAFDMDQLTGNLTQLPNMAGCSNIDGSQGKIIATICEYFVNFEIS